MANDLYAPTLGEVVNLVRGTTYKSALLGQPGPVLLGLASIQRNGGFRDDSLKTYGGESAQKLLLSPGDLYVSLKDVTQSADLLGAISRVPNSIASGRLTQDTVKLDFGDSQYPRDLLYWALRTPHYREYCRAHATGTTNLGLPREDFLAYRLPAPTRDVVTLVAALGALDHKIALFRKQSETLEVMARTLFKAWFVDFEPVRAKIEGRWQRGQSRPGLPAHLYDLFPDRLVESELGEIPEGWEMRSLDSIANYLNGLALQKFPPESDDEFLPVIKIAQLRAGNTNGADRASARIKPEYVVVDGDVLFSWSGSLEVEVWNGGRGALNQHLFKVTSDTVPKWFYFFATRHHLQNFRAIAADKATTMGHIQRKHLTDARVAVAPSEGMKKFDIAIAPLFDQLVSNAQQSRSLAQLRDTLLPKLISGELRVPDAERIVGAVE
jgi:type I restriction enzyme S subunit